MLDGNEWQTFTVFRGQDLGFALMKCGMQILKLVAVIGLVIQHCLVGVLLYPKNKMMLQKKAIPSLEVSTKYFSKQFKTKFYPTEIQLYCKSE